MKTAVMLTVLALFPVNAHAQPTAYTWPTPAVLTAPCDGGWRAAYLANTTSSNIFLRTISLRQDVASPAYVAATVFVSHPGYATEPNVLLSTYWTPWAEPWQAHETSQKYYLDSPLVRPGEWLTLVAACAMGTDHSARVTFTYSLVPNTEVPPL